MTVDESNVPVELVGKTDPGRDPDKQVNEDHYREGKTRFGPLAVVCDGMGGHAGGKEASALASATVFEEIERAPDGESPAAALKRAIEIANRKVYALGQSGMHGRPGSTVVALLFHTGGAEVAHVGDSRIYLVRGVECVQITRDHSAVQLMVDAGVLTPEQAKVHPEANKITRALGIEAEVEVEVRPHPFAYAAGDTFVLCSDGLSDLLEPDDFVRLVGGVPLAQAAGQLVDLANARGGHDNITALLVRAKGGANASTDLRTQLMPAATGSSGGVAKTLIGAPIAAPAMPAPAAVRPGISPTVVMDPPQPSAHVPSAPRSAPRPQGPSASLVIGLVLAVLVVGILGTLLYVELNGRGGRHHNGTTPLPSLVVSTPPPIDSFEPLEPSTTAPPDEEDAGLSEKLLPMGAGSGRWRDRNRPSDPSPSPSPKPNPTPHPPEPD